MAPQHPNVVDYNAGYKLTAHCSVEYLPLQPSPGDTPTAGLLTIRIAQAGTFEKVFTFDQTVAAPNLKIHKSLTVRRCTAKLQL
jgi:hypothetical protein